MGVLLSVASDLGEGFSIFLLRRPWCDLGRCSILEKKEYEGQDGGERWKVSCDKEAERAMKGTSRKCPKNRLVEQRLSQKEEKPNKTNIRKPYPLTCIM